MEKKLKHLEMIQGIINRLSTNSFLLKGWTVVLMSALFALAAADGRRMFVLLACVPAFVFWGLDGFYLHEERVYRRLYDYVRELNEDAIDFSMDTKAARELEANADGRTRGAWFAACFSKTLLPFHGVLIVAIAGVVYMHLSKGG